MFLDVALLQKLGGRRLYQGLIFELVKLVLEVASPQYITSEILYFIRYE